MKIKKTLTSIILAGALALGSGCTSEKYTKYEFDGKIGDEQVKFYQLYMGGSTLIIIKNDGKLINYIDSERLDLKIESVEIEAGNKKYTYDNSTPARQKILEEAQIKFDEYLKLILEAKEQEKQKQIQEGIENLQ